MKITGLLVTLLVVVGVNTANAQVTYVDGIPYINGEPFNAYRNDHAEAYMATFKPERHFDALVRPFAITTMSFADVGQHDGVRNYLILLDEEASWPALIRLIPEDLSKPEFQFQVSVPKNRRVTVDFSVYPQFHGTNFAVVVSMAGAKNSATITTYQGSSVSRQQADKRIERVK